MQPIDMINFAKWFVHSRRKSLVYNDQVNAVDFASNLMVELCENRAFATEHPLITEFNSYVRLHQQSKSTLGMNGYIELLERVGGPLSMHQIQVYAKAGFNESQICTMTKVSEEDVKLAIQEM